MEHEAAEVDFTKDNLKGYGESQDEGGDIVERINEINDMILELRHRGESVKGISDGFHTIGDYVDMRNHLFVALCNICSDISWKSRQHYNEENDPMFNGCFIAGMNTPTGPVTFHLKEEYWDDLNILEIDRAPEYDGYTEEDVKKRIKSLKQSGDIPKNKVIMNKKTT
ncbi:MAG: hypothetical protein ACOX6Q_01550 [Candidatus Dojkabacteria bacterium]|jgi:hypothetical protein